MTFFQTVALLLTFAAVAGYLNQKVLRLPRTIGLMAVTLAMTLALIVLAFFKVIDLSQASAFSPTWPRPIPT
jgi:CPA1 family monovalent cation:H+ antiporter